MVAWQPESGLTLDECDDLRVAHYTRFMHELRRLGELTPGWGEEIVFSPDAPKVALELVEPTVIMAGHITTAAAIVESRPSAA